MDAILEEDPISLNVNPMPYIDPTLDGGKRKKTKRKKTKRKKTIKNII
jgi:hypothetical protein